MSKRLFLALIAATTTALQFNALSAPAATATPTPSTLPLANSDFETGPYETIGTVTDWTVNGNVAVRDGEGSTSPTHAAVLSVGNDSEGDSISQQFFSTASQV